MQTFIIGNKRIDVEDHHITHVRTVEIDRRDRENVTADRLVRKPANANAFATRNQLDHYIEFPPQYRDRFPIFPTNGNSWTVVWRGDSRHPDDIFQNGFKPRVVGCVQPVWRCMESDVFQPSTVCLSTALGSGVLFPLINPGEIGRIVNDDTWLYPIALNKGDAFVNTQWVQLGVAGGHIGSAGGAAVVAGANAPAGEICVQLVSPNQIIGAVQVRRQWVNTDWTNLAGATSSIQMGSVRRNANFAGPVAAKTYASNTILNIGGAAAPLVRNAGGVSPFEVPTNYT